LSRWKIDERRLPATSVLLFRQPTRWQDYQRPITFAALIGGIPVFVLLVRVTRRGRGQRRAATTHAALVVPLDSSVKVWTSDADGRRAVAGQPPGGAEQGSWTASVHPEDVERCREIYRRALERREPFQLEYRVPDAGGVERWILDTGLPRFSGKEFEGYVGSAVDITSIGRARAELSNLSRHLMEAQELERAALATTLREDVCQRMVALTLRLHNHAVAALDGEVADINDELRGLVSQIAAASDPTHQRLDLVGLPAAASRYCGDLSGRHDLTIHFQDEDVPRDLPSDTALALFRVLQEATINAVLHSGAREVWVSLRGTGGEIRLRVVDHGVGFDRHAAIPRVGVGLVAMRERLKHVNGDSRIESSPGQGTRVEAWVPLRRDA
jgi:signal transduction histidine kinase